MDNRKQITISEILSCLEAGMDRREMAGHFGIPMAELARHFRHPKLRGRRPRAKPLSVLVDDTEEPVGTLSACDGQVPGSGSDWQQTTKQSLCQH